MYKVPFSADFRFVSLSDLRGEVTSYPRSLGKYTYSKLNSIQDDINLRESGLYRSPAEVRCFPCPLRAPWLAKS